MIIITSLVCFCLKSRRCCPVRPFRIFLEKLDGLEAQTLEKKPEPEPDEIKSEESVVIKKSMYNSQQVCVIFC